MMIHHKLLNRIFGIGSNYKLYDAEENLESSYWEMISYTILENAKSRAEDDNVWMEDALNDVIDEFIVKWKEAIDYYQDSISSSDLETYYSEIIGFIDDFMNQIYIAERQFKQNLKSNPDNISANMIEGINLKRTAFFDIIIENIQYFRAEIVKKKEIAGNIIREYPHFVIINNKIHWFAGMPLLAKILHEFNKDDNLYLSNPDLVRYCLQEKELLKIYSKPRSLESALNNEISGINKKSKLTAEEKQQIAEYVALFRNIDRLR